ncbi:MAG: aldolase [Dehalococcoidia bacterium]|nr:aldolase [Dehalococcoidia bacterium]
MLTRNDIKGMILIMHTPCKDGQEGWRYENSVDLDQTAKSAEKFVQAGVKGIALCGTSGECSALLWEEKKAFVDAVVKIVRHRVPVFAGATALGTKEVIRQSHALHDLGADGTFVGLPLWQTPTLENSVQFFADQAEASPNTPIMIYGNIAVFKSTFPTLFWEGVAKKAPTVITAKYSGGTNLAEDLKVAGHQINFLSGEAGGVYRAYKAVGGAATGYWSTMAACGPEPFVALADAVAKGDADRIESIWGDIKALPGSYPPDAGARSASYYVQASKLRTNTAGFVNVGPSRAPYTDLPEEWAKYAVAAGKSAGELGRKYSKNAVS